MVMVKIGGKEISFDGYLKSNLDLAKEVIKKDWDFLFLVDGVEGSGKSTLAQQCAAYCDPTLNLDRITFTPKEFKDAILKAKKYQSIVYDEAYGGLSSRAAMTRVNRALVKMLAEIRQRNLFIYVVIPSFFDLDKYVALWRSRALIHVYTGKRFERGRFTFYSMDRKKNLYMIGKKYYSYYKPSANFFGNFTSAYAVNEEEYRKKKTISTKTEEEEMKDIAIIAKEVRKDIVENLNTGGIGLTTAQKAAVLGVTNRTVYRYLQQAKE